MSRTQKVVDRLYGVERLSRHFDEYCVPVAHRAVPQAGKLKSLYFMAFTALGAYEAGGSVHIVGKVELLAFEILY